MLKEVVSTEPSKMKAATSPRKLAMDRTAVPVVNSPTHSMRSRCTARLIRPAADLNRSRAP